jgi:uncharacterized protein YqgQ
MWQIYSSFLNKLYNSEIVEQEEYLIADEFVAGQ